MRWSGSYAILRYVNIPACAARAALMNRGSGTTVDTAQREEERKHLQKSRGVANRGRIRASNSKLSKEMSMEYKVAEDGGRVRW